MRSFKFSFPIERDGEGRERNEVLGMRQTSNLHRYGFVLREEQLMRGQLLVYFLHLLIHLTKTFKINVELVRPVLLKKIR